MCSDQQYSEVSDIFQFLNRDTVMFVDPTTRQTLNYGHPTSCDNSPQIIIALGLDNDEHYVLTPKPVLRANLMLFGRKQVRPAKSPNTFTAQEAGIYSKAELPNFCYRVLVTKNSDTTLKLLGKDTSYEFLATSEKHSTDFC